MHSAGYFQEKVDKALAELRLDGKPAELYEPVKYMMSLGGKRLRPALMLMSHETFGGDPEMLIRPALGIEVFHNFTLLHDDIMDKAPLRRSHETVHKKWNADVAILSGDAMFVESCRLMTEVSDRHMRKVMHIFLKTATEVCEGQ